MTAPCMFGVEGLLADELREMGAENVQPQNGRVFFEGDGHILARANLCSRFGERILLVMGRFTAKTFTQLFDQTKALPWERFVGRQDAFPVKGRSVSSRLASVPDCQAIIKKAVVERLKETYRIPWFEENGSLYQIQFLLMKDEMLLMLDTSGKGLHKRGYRKNNTGAPIKETLAAAMARLARVRDRTTLIDPFCGSGTILVEGAMMAMNIAPGLRRSFAAEHWRQVPQTIWSEERKRALDAIQRDVAFQALGFDIDPAAVALTMENARLAGVEGKIKAEVRDIRDFSYHGERAVVVCNPPYGERLLDIREAARLYGVMGKLFVPKKGYSYFIISPSETFEEEFGRKADKRRKLYNGMIQCQVYQYFKS